jgi:hypothetical protein
MHSSTSHLKTLQEVGLPDALPPGLPSTLCDVGAFLDNFRRLCHRITAALFALVVLRCRNISCLVMRRDLRWEMRDTRRLSPLKTSPLLLVQIYSQRRGQ